MERFGNIEIKDLDGLKHLDGRSLWVCGFGVKVRCPGWSVEFLSL